MANRIKLFQHICLSRKHDDLMKKWKISSSFRKICLSLSKNGQSQEQQFWYSGFIHKLLSNDAWVKVIIGVTSGVTSGRNVANNLPQTLA